MPTHDLIDTTGEPLADEAVRGLLGALEAALPGRLAAAYVEGSYAARSVLDTSDLDLSLVFAGELGAAERVRVRALIDQQQERTPLDLDVWLGEERHLAEQAHPTFKLAARRLWGRELRDGIDLPPARAWGRQRMHAAYRLVIAVFDRPLPVPGVLDFPQPDDPWRGYVNRMARLPDGSEVPTTRNLLRVAGWIATARVAWEAGRYVARKSECPAGYREAIGDEWAVLIEQLDRRCRLDWHYRIPASPAEQAELRELMERTLAFENDFLARYRAFARAELTSADPARRALAAEFQAQIPDSALGAG
ncbi:MAG TPA: hypothetical protein VGE07_23745 [Herpetosiphonaceae bacterium]